MAPSNIDKCLTPQEMRTQALNSSGGLSIGIPKEDPKLDQRIPLTPDGVKVLVANKQQVVVVSGAGEAAHFSDHHYAEAGARIVKSNRQAFKCSFVVKMLPPTLDEVRMMDDGASIISLLSLRHENKATIEELQYKKITALSYELIQAPDNSFPWIKSVGEIDGIVAVNIASELLSNTHNGKGLLLGSITGIKPTNVCIIGSGTTALHAAKIASNLGAHVTVFDESIDRLRWLEEQIGKRIHTSNLHESTLRRSLINADVAIGTVRPINSGCHFWVSEDYIKQMKPKSIIVDINTDQNFCFETSSCTNLAKPVFTKHNVIHHCAPHLSNRVAKTASIALSNILYPFIQSIVQHRTGSGKTFINYNNLPSAVYIYRGVIMNKYIAQYLNLS